MSPIVLAALILAAAGILNTCGAALMLAECSGVNEPDVFLTSRLQQHNSKKRSEHLIHQVNSELFLMEAFWMNNSSFLFSKTHAIIISIFFRFYQ